MSRVGFERTTPVFERKKTVHTLDRAATVIGNVQCRVILKKLIVPAGQKFPPFIYPADPLHCS
jgi:hypothetical protein